MSSTPTHTPSRAQQRLRAYSVKNMVYSMVAVLALVFAWWALMDSPGGLQREVEVTAPAAYAAEEADWPVWVPDGLGEGWRATYARYADTAGQPTWRVGYVTPEEQYVGLDQAAELTPDWQEAVLGEATQTGSRDVSGPEGTARWQVWEGPEERALLLVAATGGPVTVVHGTAGPEVLATFAGALQAAGD